MSLTIMGMPLKFTGRTRLEAKRKALRYWATHRDVLRESMEDFLKQCRLSPDEKVITYRRQTGR